MQRFLVDPADWTQDRLTLSGETAHHLLHVLRIQPGEEVAVLDGRGREARARFVEARRGQAWLDIVSQTEHPRPEVSIVLAQALPKGEKMDWIAQKATELGAAEIAPVVTERCVMQLEGAKAESRRQRWTRIVGAAAEQCGTPWIPEIRPVVRLAEFLEGVRGRETLLVGALSGQPRPLREAVAELKAHRTKRVTLLIGPEGDLTEAEVAAALDAGGIAVSFGPRVLRVDTAAIYGLSVLVYEILSGSPFCAE